MLQFESGRGPDQGRLMVSVRKRGSAAELQDMAVAAAPAGGGPAAKKARGSDKRPEKPPKPAAGAAVLLVADDNDDDDDDWMFNAADAKGRGKGNKAGATKAKAKAKVVVPPAHAVYGATDRQSAYPGAVGAAGSRAGQTGVVGQKRPSPDGGHHFDKYDYDSDDGEIQVVSKPASRAFQIPVKAAPVAPAARGQKRRTDVYGGDDDELESDDDDAFEGAFGPPGNAPGHPCIAHIQAHQPPHDRRVRRCAAGQASGVAAGPTGARGGARGVAGAEARESAQPDPFAVDGVRDIGAVRNGRNRRNGRRRRRRRRSRRQR